MLKWDEDFFNQYMDDLQMHLFGGMSLAEIIDLAKRDHHRARRLLNLHILRNRVVFHDFYKRREELGIQSIFDQGISALFHEMERSPVKHEIVKVLGIEESMIESKVGKYELKEFQKDLLAYGMYWRKRKGDLSNLIQKIQDERNFGELD